MADLDQFWLDAMPCFAHLTCPRCGSRHAVCYYHTPTTAEFICLDCDVTHGTNLFTVTIPALSPPSATH